MLGRRLLIAAMVVAGLSGGAVAKPTASPSPSSSPDVPAVSSLVRPEQYKKMLEDRDILAVADLGDEDKNQLRHYSFYSAMVAHASLATTRKILTNYELYAKLVPYVDRATYNPQTQVLEIAGGIWKFKLLSWIHFEERGERWIHYHVVRGHFTGLDGDLFFEPAGERGTAVYMRGGVSAVNFPPKFVIERGAEIVFGFTAKRMRSYIEQSTQEPPPPARLGKQGDSHDTEVPQPRRRL